MSIGGDGGAHTTAGDLDRTISTWLRTPEEGFNTIRDWLEPPTWRQIASGFRGTAHQTVMPEVRNIGG